jgi:hypothetical protein
MPINLKGFALDKVRVGQSNSVFSATPDNIVSNSGTFATAYPSDESVPRTDYCVIVIGDGKLADVTLGFTKNEAAVALGPAVKRFDYHPRRQGFLPLPGASPTVLGKLSPSANSTRFKVPVPIGGLASAPFRIAVGSSGSGTTLTISLVTSFGSPSAGTVELLTTGGNAGQINWNAADLATYDNQIVRFQQQSYFTVDESNGKIGTIANNTLVLNPLPGPGQFPLIRIGYGLWLTTDEKVNEAAFTGNPTSGHVEWSRNTGLLKFNSTDLTTFAGKSVYYDGTLMNIGLTIPRQSLGNVNGAGTQATSITGLPTPGGDIFFRVPGVWQFAESKLVTAFDAVGKRDVVEYKANGDVQLSLVDRTTYAGQALQVLFGDVVIERGVSLRLYRTPVDLSATNALVKDLTSIHASTGAIWAEPMIAYPEVSLPSLPIESVSYPITVNVTQGSGSYLGALASHGGASPPAGLGYYIDYDAGVLRYTNHHIAEILTLREANSVATLPDQLLLTTPSLLFELETSLASGTYSTLVENVDFLLNRLPGQLEFTTTTGVTRTSGGHGSMSGNVLTDIHASFITAGVAVDDYLVIAEGAAKGVYAITARTATTLTLDVAGTTATLISYEVHSGKEALADRFYKQVEIVDPSTKIEKIRSLGAISNSPRLTVSLSYVTRFRFGLTRFSTSVTMKANDGAFTNPASLASGEVEISQTTGNVNFSTADVTLGGLVYSVFTLVQDKDFKLNPLNGFIDFTERALTGDEGLITYSTAADPTVVISEPLTWQIRKETSGAHPTPTSIITFNPNGYRIASNPAPRVFRGGRPQKTGEQVLIDATASTVTFQPDNQLTDALPHGAVVNSNERILIDYYIHDAVGGEKATNTLNFPLLASSVTILEGANSFIIKGDYTSSFEAKRMLRVEDVHYYIGSSSYASGTTTVTLSGTQVFASDVYNPKLFVSSGTTPLIASGSVPAYFVTELGNYDPIPRGMNVFKFIGDRTSSYKAGTVISFSNGTYTDFYSVKGAKFDKETNRTETTLSSNTLRQYSGIGIKYSIRPVFEAAPTQTMTNLSPLLTLPYTVWRRVSGQVGEVLESPEDYKIDPAGVLAFTEALKDQEEFSIFYTGRKIIPAGYRVRCTYTNVTAPTPENGLLNQVLTADFSAFNPDSAYYRVDTLTNYRQEMAREIDKEVTSAVPSGGPQVTNGVQPSLAQQGRESLYYKEGHHEIEDSIARTILKYYNDGINYLEDALKAADGRIIGDRDGKFKFDGLLNTSVRTVYTNVTNDIDDLFSVDGATLPLYQPNPYSRLFPTMRNLSVGPTSAGTQDYDVIGNFPNDNLSGVLDAVRRRIPRARITVATGGNASVFTVDTTGTTAMRPSAFAANMRVVIQDTAGTFYLSDTGNYVTGTTGTTITLNAAVVPAVPAGATIYLAPSDASTLLSDSAQNGFQMEWRKGKDFDVALATGKLTFIKRKPPYDASFPTAYVPKILYINEIPAGTVLQFNNTRVLNKDSAPDKIPALYGGILDDDRDETYPLVGPSLTTEFTSTTDLNTENAIINPSTGTIRDKYTSPFVGIGSLDVTKLIITNTGGSYPSPVPKIHDLVRILTGTNGATSFRRITAVTSNTVTVDSVFASQDSGFSYTIGVSSLTATGTGTFSGTNLTDGSATFTTTAKVGQTIVITNGTDTALRRQISVINSNTSITLSAAFPTATSNTYRIDNPLATYGGTNSLLPSLSTILGTEFAAIPVGSETMTNSLISFFTTVSTDLVSSAIGVTSGSTLTDATGTYITQAITTSHYVVITAGLNVGLYKIAAVNSSTQITIVGSFPANVSGMTYKIVSVFGVSNQGLTDLFSLIQQNVRFFDSISFFKGVVDNSVTVLLAGATDSGAFARALLTTDIDYRATLVQTRINSITTPATGAIGTIENTLKGTEKLYDKRYTWIDTRVNIEKGLLYKKSRAVDNRIKTAEDTLKSLIKLLTVRTT